jgi:hypothetical protein
VAGQKRQLEIAIVASMAVMPKAPEPTDPDHEVALGRVALWLSREDLQWLATRCDCSDTTSLEEKDRCARIRFRASAALHKASAMGDAEIG